MWSQEKSKILWFCSVSKVKLITRRQGFVNNNAACPNVSYLYVTRDCVLRDARLEPLLSDLEARRVDGHARLEVVDAAEDEVDGAAAAAEAAAPDAPHEVVKVLDGRDVVVVRLELDVGVDGFQGLRRRGHLGQPRLDIRSIPYFW